MKDYLKEVSREMPVVFKHYRRSLLTLLILCFASGLWFAHEVKKSGGSFRSLPLYPALTMAMAFGTLGLVSDIQTRTLRRKGVL